MVEPYPESIAHVYDLIVYGEKDVFLSEKEIAGITRFLPREEKCRIIDIGCGNGRALLPLAEHGHLLTGIDLSKPMLNICSARLAERRLNADLIHADALLFQSETLYDAALFLDSSLCYFPTVQSVQTMLAHVFDLLVSEGVLLVENRILLSDASESEQPMNFTVADAHTTVHYSGEQKYNKATGVISTHLGVVVYEDAKEPYHCEYTEQLLHITSDEMHKMIQATGFTIEECYDDLTGVSASFSEAATYVIIAKKP